MAETEVEIQFNTARLVQGAEAAWPSANQKLGVEFTKRISSPIWDWPKGDSPRDIVDKGQLRSSYGGKSESATVYRHTWATRYAMAVHEGAVINNAFGRGIRTTMPGRPWTRVTLREYNFAGAYAKIAQAEMQKRAGSA